MIKLERNVTPAFLTPAERKNLTDIFKTTGKDVWNDNRIRSILLDLSHKKCAYCECDISTESKYMEVEHFEHKDKYPDKVVDWDNLLPSCKRCNGSKGTHDVIDVPIVNPFLDHPRDHFQFFLYQLRPKTPKGEATEIALNLNHHERAVMLRFQVGEAVQNNTKEACDKLKLFQQNPTTLRKNKLMTSIEGLLSECQPSKQYASTAATVLHTYPLYEQLRLSLKSLNLWNNDLESLHNISLGICL